MLPWHLYSQPIAAGWWGGTHPESQACPGGTHSEQDTEMTDIWPQALGVLFLFLAGLRVGLITQRGNKFTWDGSLVICKVVYSSPGLLSFSTLRCRYGGAILPWAGLTCLGSSATWGYDYTSEGPSSTRLALILTERVLPRDPGRLWGWAFTRGAATLASTPSVRTEPQETSQRSQIRTWYCWARGYRTPP